MAGDGRVTVSERRSMGVTGRSAYTPPLKGDPAALDIPTRMDERTCERCGAQNRADATYCWRYYASLGGGSSPPETVAAGRIGAATYASGTGNGSVMTAAPPPPVAPPTPGSDRARWVVKGVLFVVGFAAGWWLVSHVFFTAFPFPDQIAGQPRVESEEAEQAAEALASIAAILDVEMEMAIYGSELQPAYVMMAFEVPESGPLTQVPAFGQTPAGDFSFRCGPDAQGAACLWERDGMVVGIGGIGHTPEELEPVARQVRAELRS